MTSSNDTGGSTNTEGQAQAARAALRPDLGDREVQDDLVLSLDLGTWSSTATLFFNQKTKEIFEPKGVDTLRAGLAALLRDDALRPVAARIGTELGEVCKRDRELKDEAVPMSLDELATLLDGDDLDPVTHRLARATSIALERVLSFPDHAQIRDALAPVLHQIYDTTFDLPALRTLYLWPMPVNPEGRHEVSSILSLPPTTFDDAQLLDDPATPFTRDGVVFPGIKRRLTKVEPVPTLEHAAIPSGWKPDTEVLLGKAIADLVRRVELGALDGKHPGELRKDKARLRDFVVTFPTTLAPQAKERMRRFIVDALGCMDGDVRLQWDEAVAAAMYFLVRAMSGFREAGLDAFRHRASPILGSKGTAWRQHVLIIDIGGGTTDIALLAVDLLDRSPQPRAEPGEDPELTGREYLLRPRVLGTTGHPQIGGDLLTLRMFYWLKAAIADAVSPDDQLGSLATRIVHSRDLDPVPKAIRQSLRELVRTHYTGGPAADTAEHTLRPRTVAFEKLWTAVENGKANPVDTSVCTDQGGRKFRMSGNLVKELPEDCPWRTKLSEFTDPIELTAADFDALQRPIIEVAAGLAADLVRRSLGGDTGARLDVIALSGRTTSMAGADRIVADILARELARTDGPGPVAWDPHGIVVERTYAKHAASIGAAWAASGSDLYDNGVCKLGRDVVQVQVSDLLATLPMDLGLAGADGLPVPLLRAGTRFDMADLTGYWSSVVFTRSAWRPLSPLVSLHRILAAPMRKRFHSMVWGVYRHDRTEASTGTIWYQVQINQDLTPKLLLCKGTKHGVRPWLHPDDGTRFASGDAVELRGLPRSAKYFEGDKLVMVPRIEVVQVEEAVHDPVQLFAAGPADEILRCLVSSDGYLDGWKSASWPQDVANQPGELATSAGVAARPLPMPQHQNEAPARYRFIADGEPCGELDLPAFRRGHGPDQGTPHWAVLDGRGTLRVCAGYPSYLAASTLNEMRGCPGLVYLASMADGSPDWDAEWDPFTGDH